MSYQAAHKSMWQGRHDETALTKQYWHEQIDLIDLSKTSASSDNYKAMILGYAIDEGVRRNQGRPGAYKGPMAIRKQLAKLPYNHNFAVADLGDISNKQSMEEAQQMLATHVANLVQEKVFPIILGGGHDIACGHYIGLQKALRSRKKNRIGIVNFDAHFDLRPIVKKANSGTPFHQILKNNSEQAEYFVLGIQSQSNTKSLFDVAEKYKVSYLSNLECQLTNMDQIKGKLEPFVKRNDFIYITIDMDGFSSAYAPGVSAPSPLGFTPYFALQTLEYLFQSKKVISLDIAELNPEYDRDNLSSNLAARLIDHVLSLI